MNPTDRVLAPIVAEMLGLPDGELDADRPLGELGADSLTAAELSATIEERLGLIVPMERFLGEDTLAALERDVAAELAAVGR